MPRPLAHFTGRAEELGKVRALVDGSAAGLDGRRVSISVIDGMAGVGKTAFAVHAAHLLASQFPDGQLFVDLHGHTAGQRPVAAADALGAVLLSAGVAAQFIPPDIDGRAALWRDRLADQRMLIVLDDAVGHEQVRPLLPGGAECLVLVTSRRRLAALEDAEPLTLGTLPPAQAAELFARLAGVRLQVESAAIAELVDLCGWLPLAIRLLAGRLRNHSSWTVRYLTDTLRDAQDRLAEMHAERVAVEAAFSLSYQDLPASQQSLFRRLGLLPAPDVDAYAAAALDNTSLAQARQGLDALYNNHLIDEPFPGRYRLHDLIRAYARTLAAGNDATSNAATVGRLLDYYLHTAATANLHIALRSDRAMPRIARFPAASPDLATRRSAQAWLTAERASLSACLHHAAAHSRTVHAADLARAMHSFLCIAGHWDQALHIHQTVLATARLSGDRHGEANALNDLGFVQRLTGDYPAATASLTRALTLYRDLGDRLGQANALDALARVGFLTDEYPAATASLTRALTLYRDLGDPLGQASVLNNLGIVAYATSQYRTASARLAQALTLYRDLDHRLGQANALNNLGIVQRLTGDCPAATAALTDALALYRDLGDRIGQANALNDLGIVQQLTGQHAAATASLTQSLAIFRQLDHRHGQANALNSLGVVQRVTGEHQAAAASMTQALTLYRHLGHRYGQAETLNNLGSLLLACPGGDDAIARYRQALSLARDIHAPLEEARALQGISQCLLAARDTSGATAHLEQALSIYQLIGVPETEQVTAALSRLQTYTPADGE